MNSPGDSPTGRLSRALAAAAPPRRVLDALAGEPPEVEPGQLWRARRANRSLLVLTSARDGATVEVSPVTVDEVSDSDAVDLPAAASALSAPISVWLGLTRWLPLRALERYTGDLLIGSAGEQILDAVTDAGHPGSPALSPADPKIVSRARMLDTLAELAAIPVPAGSGELAELLREERIPLGDLEQLLLLPTAGALDVARGRRPISAEQAQQLAARVGRDPEQLLAANPAPPPALVEWMSRPAQRRKLVRLAQKAQLNEDTAFSHATYSVYAMAARAAGDREADAAWAALGQRYFEAVLDDA